jgi:hypothetical protein
MTEKFTQGEWVTRPGNTTVLDKKSNPIAMVYRAEYYRSKEESFANAALIKAAPVMYNRLKEVKSDFRALLFNPYISEHTKECIKVMIDHIEDDLKKARGEE